VVVVVVLVVVVVVAACIRTLTQWLTYRKWILPQLLSLCRCICKYLTDHFMKQDRQQFLVNDQRDAQFFSMYLLIFLTVYMFRAHRAHHQERQIVSIQPLVAVGGCVVCTRHGHRHRVTATRGCTDTICLS